MNAQQLAKQAKEEAKAYTNILSKTIIEKIQLAHIAQWLDTQDESVRAKAATTACEAMDLLRSSSSD